MSEQWAITLAGFVVAGVLAWVGLVHRRHSDLQRSHNELAVKVAGMPSGTKFDELIKKISKIEGYLEVLLGRDNVRTE